MITSILHIVLLSLLIPGIPVLEPHYYQLEAKEFFALKEVSHQIDPEKVNVELLEAAIFYATNEVRAREKRSTFDYNPILNHSARFHAGYMAKEKTVDHLNRSAKKYKTPFDRTLAFEGDFTAVAENLARLPILALGENGQFFVDEKGRVVNKERQVLPVMTYSQLAHVVVEGWMQSPGHRANIMNDFELLGIGVSEVSFNKDGVPEIYLVQNFANQ